MNMVFNRYVLSPFIALISVLCMRFACEAYGLFAPVAVVLCAILAPAVVIMRTKKDGLMKIRPVLLAMLTSGLGAGASVTLLAAPGSTAFGIMCAITFLPGVVIYASVLARQIGMPLAEGLGLAALSSIATFVVLVARPSFAALLALLLGAGLAISWASVLVPYRLASKAASKEDEE